MIYELKIDTKGFKGTAQIDVPKFSERMKLLKETEIKNGEKLDELDKAEQLVELSKMKCKKLELEHPEIKVSSVDELEMYQDGLAVIYEIAAVILNGIPLGNLQAK